VNIDGIKEQRQSSLKLPELPLALLIRADDKSRCTKMLVLFLVPTIFIILLSGANYAKDGSSQSLSSGTGLFAIRSEEWGRAGHFPLSDKQNRNVVQKLYETMTLQERAHAFLPESIAIFKKYPLQTIEAFFEDAQPVGSSGSRNTGSHHLSYPLGGAGCYYGRSR
jgi:hypothetical protein